MREPPEVALFRTKHGWRRFLPDYNEHEQYDEVGYPILSGWYLLNSTDCKVVASLQPGPLQSVEAAHYGSEVGCWRPVDPEYYAREDLLDMLRAAKAAAAQDNTTPARTVDEETRDWRQSDQCDPGFYSRFKYERPIEREGPGAARVREEAGKYEMCHGMGDGTAGSSSDAQPLEDESPG